MHIFILILLLLALLIIPSLLDNGHVEYTRGEMMQDLKDGNIVYAGISPSRQTPTGEVDFRLKKRGGKNVVCDGCV